MTAEISREKRIELYRNLLIARKLYQTLHALYRKGSSQANFTAGEGEEAVPVAVCANLRRDDYFKPNFRQLACLFAKEGYTLAEAVSYKLFDPERGFMGFSLSLGEDVSVYTGAALSAQMRKTDQVSVCAFGDGTASKGPIHEAMVSAAAWKLPMIFILQNNKYCGGTHYSKTYALEDLSDRAKGYGMPGQTVDANDVIATYEVVKEYVDRARSGGGPGLIVADTYRLSPYFEVSPGKLPPENYRTQAEVEEQRKRDPILRYQKTLMDTGLLTETDIQDFEKEVESQLDAALEGARSLPRMTYESYIKSAVAEL